MPSARIDLRIDSEYKLLLEKAAVLSGAKSLTDYIMETIIPVAERDVASANSTELPTAKFDAFIAACEQAEAPNEALKDAFKASKAMGFE